MRGRVRGAFVHYDRVFTRDTDVYREVYRAREFAEICLVGDGDTDLDLYIYDEYGNLICSSTGYFRSRVLQLDAALAGRIRDRDRKPGWCI